MRATTIAITIACLSCSSDEAADPPIDEIDPACAGEEEPAPSARVDELPWDLERDPVGDTPVCPASDPGCDALAEPDAPDELDLPELDDAGRVTYGLSDPLTSTGRYRVWPNGRIPYRYARTSSGAIQVNATTRERLSQAMTNWEQLTEGRIKFRPRQSSDTAYVLIKEGSPRVSPFVGYRKDSVQSMYLRDSEYITVIKHELGHVIGLHHEQRRNDRLSYIQVRKANIVNTTSCQYQFSVCSDCKKVGTYDRSSVMHYRTTDLGNCRTGPVLLKLDGSWITHVWKLSAKDLTTVATMYDASATEPPPPPPPPSPAPPVLPESGSIIAGEMCTGITGNSRDPGALLAAETCDGGGDQDWRLTADGQLRVQHSLQCAAVVGCSAPGAAVEQATCTPEAPDQKWTFEAMALVHGATARCAQVADGKLVLAACTGEPSQVLDYRPETETLELGGQCIAAVDGDAVLAACDGTDAQRWFQARGGFVTRANTARCLSVGATGAIAVGECTDAVEQRWALRGEIRDGRAGLCLTAGTPHTLAACDGLPAQQFTLWSR